jgi:nucleoside-diphosphate-sugar epimerase
LEEVSEMRIVITGATGNIGTSLLARLAHEPAVTEIIGIARRLPQLAVPKTRFVAADVAHDDLEPLFRQAHAVVHLAWRIQPSRKQSELAQTNVQGSRRVFDAAARCSVPSLIYASSVGGYSSAPKDRLLDESWPYQGLVSSLYSRQKALVEALLDTLQAERPSLRVVRLRPALSFKREAASGIRRLFIGPIVPKWLFDRRFLRMVPDNPRLRFQAVHSLDVAEAYRLAILSDSHGPFNIAADPILDPASLATLFDARRVHVSAPLMRSMTNITWRLHLHPVDPGWIDMAFESPLMDTRRAHAELGWLPLRSSTQALQELLDGIKDGDALDTAPLAGFGRKRYVEKRQLPEAERPAFGG